MAPPNYGPHRAVTGSEAREADVRASREFGIPSLVLMEHAARGIAACAAKEWARAGVAGPVLVVCGPGNNGGDGYGCARFLSSWGVPVRIVRASPTAPSSPDARLEHDLATRDVDGAAFTGLGEKDSVGESLDRALRGAPVIVDALFGVGLSRPLDAHYVSVVERLNASDSLRIAVDVPSGLDADSGAPMPVAVRAALTVAMGMPKRGCFTPLGAPFAGRVVEIDIGLPAAIHRRFLA